MSTERAVDPATSPPADGGGAGRVFALARLGLAVLVLVAVSIALAKNWSAVARHLADVSGPAWALAIAVSLASPILTVLGWRALLADLGSPLHLAPASGVFLVGQLGKYLPGSVWSVVAQTEMAARLGVPRRRTGIVGLVTMALALLTGAAVGLPAIPLLLRRGGGDSVWFVAVAAALLVLAFWPPLLNRMIALGLRMLRRDPLEHAFSGRALLAAALWTTLAWLCTGAITLAFAGEFVEQGTSRWQLLIICLSGFCLASAVGMASILLPAGVGVREGVLLLLLVTVMPTSAATAVVVLTRFVTVAADVIWAALGWAWARTHHLLPDT